MPAGGTGMSPNEFVTIKFDLSFRFIKRKKWVVATCPSLKVSSQGATEKEAKKNLAEAISLFIESCIEHGTLEAE